jgi:hypothetical protein
VNAHFPQAHLDVAMSRRVKGFMEPRLGRAGRAPERLLVPSDLHPWFVERGNAMVDELATSPWHFVGELDDLRPEPDPGTGLDPDAVPEAEVLEVAVAFIAAELLVRAGSRAGAHAGRAVSEGGSERQEGASRTALGRVRRVVRRALARLGQRGTSAQ